MLSFDSVRGVRNLYGLRLTRKAPVCLPQLAGEQTSSEPAHYKLLAKGTSMSEKSKGFMASLDEWTEENVFSPLRDAWLPESQDPLPQTVGVTFLEENVKKAIRTKVLQSYRNGLKAGPSVKQRQYARR